MGARVGMGVLQAYLVVQALVEVVAILEVCLADLRFV
jgi:hypothetical protein